GCFLVGMSGDFPGVTPMLGLLRLGVGFCLRGFFWPCGRYREERVCAHGQHGVPVEGMPEPELVLVEPGLALGLLETFLYRPAFPGNPDKDAYGNHARAVGDEECEVGWIGYLTADQYLVMVGIGAGKCPLIIAVAFTATAA